MRTAFRHAAMTAIITTSLCTSTLHSEVPFTVPEHFEAVEYASDELAHDIFSLTLDARGQVVVAGLNYVKRLLDTDRDGIADKAQLITPLPKSGAHGLLFDGTDLICTGDNAIWRFADTNGDGVADGEPKTLGTLRHSEHGANGLTWGPDGAIYLIGGNDANITASHVGTAHSPVRAPSMGAIVRFNPDGTQSEVIAHGFRNPYDLAFDANGRLFTFDSDGERDHHLPWYAPTRVFDVAQGQHHGWVLKGWQRSWSRPAVFFDNVERLVEVGRGSPTGVVVYRHTAFPERYRNGLFVACWSLGNIYFCPRTPHGSTDTATLETFLKPTGSAGFAPVAMSIDPKGDLFVAIGGRGTRGGVYRIRYIGETEKHALPLDDLTQLLTAPQPLSAWSRAQWKPLAQKLGRDAVVDAMADSARAIPQRMRAVEILVDSFGGIPIDQAAEVAMTLVRNKPEGFAPLLSRMAWALSRADAEMTETHAYLLAALSNVKDPSVRRSVWESLGTRDKPLTGSAARELDWSSLLDDDRRVRAAALTVARLWHYEPQGMDAAWLSARIRDVPHAEDVPVLLSRIQNPKRPWERLDAIRLMQQALGDIVIQDEKDTLNVGYAAQAPDHFSDSLREQTAMRLTERLPTGDPEIDDELIRLLAMLGEPVDGLPEKLAATWTAESHPVHDIHIALALCRIGGERSIAVTTQTAAMFTRLQSKMAARSMHPSRNWPRHVGDTFTRLIELDPKLSAAFIESPDFGHPDHTLLAERLDDVNRLAAARRMLVRAKANNQWTPELIDLLGILPAAEALPAIRPLWPKPAWRDAAARLLARHADSEDRDRLVKSLNTVDANTARDAAIALSRIRFPTTTEDITAAMSALGRHEHQAAAAQALTTLLQQWTGQNPEVPKDAGLFRTWMKWFAVAQPTAAKKIAGFDGIDATEWSHRLSQIDWSTGDATRGKDLYAQRACATCHDGQRPMGPPLKGIGARFGVEDLFANILFPNASISSTYQAVQIITKDGQTVIGMPIYASAAVTILETGPNQTVRFSAEQIASSGPATTSPMPPGLLTGLTDAQLADFYAYLKTLK